MVRLRACNYGRQSAGDASSVSDQHKVNARVCAENDWDEVVRRKDLVSASRFGRTPREEWPLLVEDVSERRIDVVVMWDLSRGDRTVATWAGFVDLCRDRGVLIHATSHGRTYDPRVPRDWRVLMDDGVEASYDSEQKSLAVRRGHKENAVAGKPHGSAAYGYTRVYDPHDRKVFRDVPNDDAEVVREIVARCAKEEPITHIVEDLNQRGIPGPRGGRWTTRTVKQFATHPRYIGLRRHNGELHEAQWEPIITDRAQWERAVRVLTAPNRKAAAPGSRRYLLSYLATAPCNSGLNADPGTTSGRSPRYRCVGDGCVSIGVAELNMYVTRIMLARLAKHDARRYFAPADDAVRLAEAEVARLQARLDEARASFARPDGISAEALAQLERAVQPELLKAMDRLASFSTCPAGLELMGGGEFTEQLGWPRWRTLPLAGQRSVIKRVFELIEVGPTTTPLSRWSTERDRERSAMERTTVKLREP
ncbi:hypothetical protein SUDANB95_05470 [Actinosynnema sp. ALI-1.44]